jgi:hypothetical protein
MAAAWEPDEEDAAFLRVYGPWQPLTPAQAVELMAGFPAPWWVVGGQAIEAFTGVRRFHEDLDLVVYSHDFPAFREQVSSRYHVWSNHGGTLRVVDDRHPEPLHPRSPIWLREHALAPWVVDCPLNPSVDGRWQSKRDPAHVADLDEVTWVAGDGVRYLNPEIVLHYKGAQLRAKDELDLQHTWPLLPEEKRRWLLDALRTTYGADHVWIDRLDRS